MSRAGSAAAAPVAVPLTFVIPSVARNLLVLAGYVRDIGCRTKETSNVHKRVPTCRKAFSKSLSAIDH